MPIVLTLLTFLAMAATFWGRNGGKDWRPAVLQAALAWGALVALSSEGLSLLNALTSPWVSLFWLASLGVSLGWGYRNGALKGVWRTLRARLHLREPELVLLVAGLAAISAVLLVVAWVAPPNNTDSMHYHMARVAHWAQNRSLRHYPTGFDPQLFQPIGAELGILHLRLLWGSDRPANLVQWAAMVGCLVGVSALAGLLGADRRGQVLASCLVASLPIGILESTSTQNDYVAAFWLVALAYYIISAKLREPGPWEWCGIGLSLGLGLLTKGTFYPYAVPLLAWLFLPRLRRPSCTRRIGEAAAAMVIAALVNLGFWARNVSTFGLPLGSGETLSRFTRARFTPASISYSWLTNIALNFSTPSEQANSYLVQTISRIGAGIHEGVDHFDLIWGWNNENLAGNPIHVALVSLAVGWLLMVKPNAYRPVARQYAVAVVASVLVVFTVIAFDVYGVRYQLPFFIAAAPVVGVASTQIRKPRLTEAASAIMLLAALPWVLLNASRPIVGWKPRTMTESIFRESPVRILFANWASLQDPYVAAAGAIKETDCRRVGLRLDSHDLEYPWWWLLEAPESGFRLETVYALPWLEKLVDPEFRACAVLCTICADERKTLYGLPLVKDFGPVLLYAGPIGTAEEGG